MKAGCQICQVISGDIFVVFSDLYVAISFKDILWDIISLSKRNFPKTFPFFGLLKLFCYLLNSPRLLENVFYDIKNDIYIMNMSVNKPLCKSREVCQVS